MGKCHYYQINQRGFAILKKLEAGMSYEDALTHNDVITKTSEALQPAIGAFTQSEDPCVRAEAALGAIFGPADPRIAKAIEIFRRPATRESSDREDFNWDF